MPQITSGCIHIFPFFTPNLIPVFFWNILSRTYCLPLNDLLFWNFLLALSLPSRDFHKVRKTNNRSSSKSYTSIGIFHLEFNFFIATLHFSVYRGELNKILSRMTIAFLLLLFCAQLCFRVDFKGEIFWLLEDTLGQKLFLSSFWIAKKNWCNRVFNIESIM